MASVEIQVFLLQKRLSRIYNKEKLAQLADARIIFIREVDVFSDIHKELISVFGSPLILFLLDIRQRLRPSQILMGAVHFVPEMSRQWSLEVRTAAKEKPDGFVVSCVTRRDLWLNGLPAVMMYVWECKNDVSGEVGLDSL